MSKRVIEVGLSVEDFGGFGECQDATAAAEALAAQELKEAGITDQQLRGLTLEATFTEFDSGNPSHACGYFEVEISGAWAEAAESAWLRYVEE